MARTRGFHSSRKGGSARRYRKGDIFGIVLRRIPKGPRLGGKRRGRHSPRWRRLGFSWPQTPGGR